MSIDVRFSTGANTADADHGGCGIDLPDSARDNLKTAATDIVDAVATVLDAEYDTTTTVQQIKDAVIALLS